jgi:hypothetical protein
MNGIPETTSFYIAGYAVIFGGMLMYLISLFVRFRNLRQDERMFEELEKAPKLPTIKAAGKKKELDSK